MIFSIWSLSCKNTKGSLVLPRRRRDLFWEEVFPPPVLFPPLWSVLVERPCKDEVPRPSPRLPLEPLEPLEVVVPPMAEDTAEAVVDAEVSLEKEEESAVGERAREGTSLNAPPLPLLPPLPPLPRLPVSLLLEEVLFASVLPPVMEEDNPSPSKIRSNILSHNKSYTSFSCFKASNHNGPNILSTCSPLLLVLLLVLSSLTMSFNVAVRSNTRPDGNTSD